MVTCCCNSDEAVGVPADVPGVRRRLLLVGVEAKGAGLGLAVGVVLDGVLGDGLDASGVLGVAAEVLTVDIVVNGELPVLVDGVVAGVF